MGTADPDHSAVLPKNPRKDRAMRKRIWISGAIVLTVCLLLLLLLPKPKRNEKTDEVKENVVPTNQPHQRAEPPPLQESHDRRIERIAATLPPRTPLAEAIAETNPAAALELQAWQTPIEFYGKVIDENSNAVA